MNIMINAVDTGVEIIATNLEIAVKTNLRAKVDEKGTFTVPAKTLLDYINLLPDSQIDFLLENNELVVKCVGSSTKIKGSPSEEFPVVPETDEKNVYTISVNKFKDGLSKTIIAVAKNEIRPELSGIYMNFFGSRYKGLVLASTDSYRLAEAKAQEILNEMAEKITPDNEEVLKKIAQTAMTGKGAEYSKDTLAILAVKAVKLVAEDNLPIDRDNIKIEKR